MADSSHQGDGGGKETNSIGQLNMNAEEEQGQEGRRKYRINLSAKTRMEAEKVDRQRHLCILSLSLRVLYMHIEISPYLSMR